MQYLGQSMASVLYRSTHCIISLLASVYAFHTSSRRVKSLLSYIAVVATRYWYGIIDHAPDLPVPSSTNVLALLCPGIE